MQGNAALLQPITRLSILPRLWTARSRDRAAFRKRDQGSPLAGSVGPHLCVGPDGRWQTFQRMPCFGLRATQTLRDNAPRQGHVKETEIHEVAECQHLQVLHCPENAISFAPLWLPLWHTVRLEMGPGAIFGLPKKVHCMHAATERKHRFSDWPGQCGSQSSTGACLT